MFRVRIGLESRVQRTWAEGEWLVFDDAHAHSAANTHPHTARYILHVTFPHPRLLEFVEGEMMRLRLAGGQARRAHI